METIARSTSLWGPFTSNPANPVLTNANTTEYCEVYLFISALTDLFGPITSSNGNILIWLVVFFLVLISVGWARGYFP